MATVTFIKYQKQSAGALHGVAGYVSQEQKTQQADGWQLVSGQNCTTQLAAQEFIATRQMHRKDSPVWFYHYVQSFSPDEEITGALAHQVAREFAQQAWPDSEVLIATHTDAEHIHTHFIVNSVCYDRMIAKREEQIEEAKKQIEELQNISEMLRSRQAKLKRDISLIDDILQDGKMAEAHLKMLVEKILVHEEDGKLDLEIRLKAPFRDHLDIFENGERTDSVLSAEFDYDRLGAIIYGDYYAG